MTLHMIKENRYFTYVLKENFGLLLTLASFMLWLLSLRYSDLQKISDFGLITALPISYFISLGLLTFSFFIVLLGKKKHSLLYLQVFMLIIFLHLTPQIIEHARQRYAYSAFGLSDYILRNARINKEIIPFYNWPSFQIFISIFVNITGIDPNILIGLTSPTVLEIMYFLPLYMFFDSMLNMQQKWLAIWVFYIANWIGRGYLSSQALGVFFFVLIIALCVRDIREGRLIAFKSKGSRRFMFITILFFSTVVMGHALTSVVLLNLLIVLFLCKYIRSKTFIVLSSSILILWNVYFAKNFLNANLIKILPHILDILYIFYRNIGYTTIFIKIEERLIVSLFKIGFSVIILLFAFSGFILSFRKKEKWNNDKIVIAGLVGIWLPSTVLVYGGELFLRLWLLGLIMVSYFVSKNLYSSKMFIILVTFLLILAPALHTVAQYGNEKIDYITPSEIEGASFIYDKIKGGYIIGGRPWGRFRNSFDQNKVISFNFFTNITPTLFNMGLKEDNLALYVCIGRGEIEYYRIMYSEPDLLVNFEDALDKSPYHYRIYSNPNLDIYFTQSRIR